MNQSQASGKGIKFVPTSIMTGIKVKIPRQRIRALWEDACLNWLSSLVPIVEIIVIIDISVILVIIVVVVPCPCTSPVAEVVPTREELSSFFGWERA